VCVASGRHVSHRREVVMLLQLAVTPWRSRRVSKPFPAPTVRHIGAESHRLREQSLSVFAECPGGRGSPREARDALLVRSGALDECEADAREPDCLHHAKTHRLVLERNSLPNQMGCNALSSLQARPAKTPQSGFLLSAFLATIKSAVKTMSLMILRMCQDKLPEYWYHRVSLVAPWPRKGHASAGRARLVW
jgi:hypothetical protein